MNTNRKLYARASALPAIAAALVLSSTPLSAQEVQPVTTEPPPAATAEPAPAPEATPVTTQTTTTTTEEPVTEAAPVARKTTRTITRTTRTATAKPVPTARAVTPRTAASTIAPAAPVAAPAVPAAPAKSESAVAPVIDVNSPPAAAPTIAAAPPVKHDETLPIAAGGALALLALGGAGLALVKRRRRHEEAWIEDEPTENEPVALVAQGPEPMVHEEQPALVAPSAFAWGNSRAETTRSAAPVADDGDDRMPGESWVERAYRGPTPNNPSVSLRARVKRAAFFDKREREVAAGTAKPVDMDAGLPEAMVEEQERELA
jgi:resuscitation-promoting factor RpfA